MAAACEGYLESAEAGLLELAAVVMELVEVERLLGQAKAGMAKRGREDAGYFRSKDRAWM